MFKKLIPLLFLSSSHDKAPADHDVTPFVGANSLAPTATRINSRPLFKALAGEERPGSMAGLLFLLVLLLHLWLGLWLLTPAVPPQTPVPMVMEVSLVALPGQKAEITPKAPAKPEPPKKQTVKKPVKKKLPVIAKQPAQLKQEALSKAQTSVDQKPTAAPTAPQVVSQQPASVKSEPKISTGVIALQRIPPKYPARAANRHIEGWVKIEFTITTSGGVKDAVVVEAEPAEIFDEAALNAINQWTFQQKIANGVAVEQRAVQTLQFKLTR